jgi:transcriptional regulator with XRE-family HTH domain
MTLASAHRRLAMRLKRLREDRKMTQEALAARAGISRVYLAMIETERQDPRLSTLVKLAKALKVKIGELVD